MTNVIRKSEVGKPTLREADPTKDKQTEAKAETVIHKHASWPREVWILLVFVAGLATGIGCTLFTTTSLFPMANSATQNAFMAGQVTGAVTGRK